MTRKVLVIDDSELIRGIAVLGLEGLAGWQVATASGGREGLELATNERPDILLDIVIPRR